MSVINLLSAPLKLQRTDLLHEIQNNSRLHHAQVIGADRKRSLERGWQKRLAKGRRKIGEGYPCTLLLKFRRVTIRGAQPSARLSEEICLSEGSAEVSQRALRGLCGVLRGSVGFSEVFRGSDPILVGISALLNSEEKLPFYEAPDGRLEPS